MSSNVRRPFSKRRLLAHGNGRPNSSLPSLLIRFLYKIHLANYLDSKHFYRANKKTTEIVICVISQTGGRIFHRSLGLALMGHGSLRGLDGGFVSEVIMLHGVQVLIELVHQRDASGNVQLHNVLVAHMVEVLHLATETHELMRQTRLHLNASWGLEFLFGNGVLSAICVCFFSLTTARMVLPCAAMSTRWPDLMAGTMLSCQ